MPVIMLSSPFRTRCGVEAARDAGATEFCAKPVTAQEMMRKLAAIIDKPRAFVRSAAYQGPDRRRRRDPEYLGGEKTQRRIPVVLDDAAGGDQ